MEQVALKSLQAEPVEAGDVGLQPREKPKRPAVPRRGGIVRWLSLQWGLLRAMIFAALSLMLFVAVWHLLTKYRVNIYVRFVNVPSPEQVLARAARALHDPRFFAHVALSCRRIAIGFVLASIAAIPLGLLMGRFRLIREWIFPVTEVLRPIPAIAWVPMSIMLWPSNEESIVFITYLGSFFPILLNTLHGMTMVDPCWYARRNASARARRRSSKRSISRRPCRTYSPD